MKLFADAHEWSKSGLDVDMDFHNNDKGRNIGLNYNPFSDNVIISNAVMIALDNGELVYLSPLGSRGRILPNTIEIPTNQ